MSRLKPLWVLLGLLVTMTGCSAEIFFKTDIRQKKYPAGWDAGKDGVSNVDGRKVGSDPQDVDSHHDVVPDSQDDPDHDGMPNLWEQRLGYDANNADSFSDGIIDCDRDFDKDGAADCWEIKYGFDPRDPGDQAKDKDKDGYNNGEEAVAGTDPLDPTSVPGSLVLFDGQAGVVGRTHVAAVQGTLSRCSDGEMVLATASDVKPEADDARFIPCTGAPRALQVTLGALTGPSQTVYVWRRLASGVVDVPVSAAITIDTAGPAQGTLMVRSVVTGAISLHQTPPTDADYARVVVRRYAESDCSARGAAEGTGVAFGLGATDATDTGLAVGAAVCYRAFWYDDLGNETAQTPPTTLSGPGPGEGTLTLTAVGPLTFSLTHTKPANAAYDHVVVRRADTAAPGAASCAALVGPADGTGVAVSGPAAIGVTDTGNGLALNTAYCYKAFWFDAFGNASAQSTGFPTYSGQGPGAGALTLAATTPLAPLAINLTHTLPASALYDHVVVRRAATGAGAPSCAALTDATTGAGVTVASPSTSSIADSAGLALATAYCYKAFWFDAYGNVTPQAGGNPTYSGLGPGVGTLTFAALGALSIGMSHTVPAAAAYDHVVVRRASANFAAGIPSCATAIADQAAGAGVTVTSPAAATITDLANGLALDTAYCYRAFWLDAFGNASAQAAGFPTYDGIGPVPVGALAFSSSTYDSVTLGHTAPTEANYASIALRRNTAGCSASGAGAGSAVGIATNATTVTDSGLQPSTTYCYKVFWFDTFGNFQTAFVDNLTTPALTCSLTSGHLVYYSGSSVSLTFDCSATVTMVTSTTKPAYLTAVFSGVQVTFTGSPVGASTANWSFAVNGATTTGAAAAVSTTVLATTGLMTTDTTITATPTPVYNTDVGLVQRSVLDATWDGAMANVALKATPGGEIATDLHGVTYQANCATATGSYVCNGAGSTPAVNTKDGDLRLHWKFSAFDQGSYFLDVNHRITIESGINDLTLDTATLAVPIQTNGNVTITHVGSSIDANVDSMGFSYSAAISPGASVTAPVVGLLYPIKDGNDSFFLRKIGVDRTDDPSGGASGINQSSAECKQSTSNLLDYRLAGLAAGKFAVAGITLTGSDQNLTFKVTDLSGCIAAVPLTAVPFGGAASENVVASNLTVFPEGVNERVGVALAHRDLTNSVSRLIVAKLDPAAFPAGSIIYDPNYHPASTVKAVYTASGVNELDRLRIRWVDEAGTGQFYVAFREATAIKVVQLLSTKGASYGLSSATIEPGVLADEDLLTNNYGALDMAAGRIGAKTAVGVVYRKAADGKCYWRRFRNGLAEQGNSLLISTGDCYFPTVHFNTATSRFPVTFVDKVGGVYVVRAAEISVDPATASDTISAPMTVVSTGDATNKFNKLTTDFNQTDNWMAVFYRLDSAGDANAIKFHGYHVRGR